jgi:hypothetical protein
MSTILRSLKRLEEENDTAKEKSVLPVYGTRQAMQRAVRFAWLKGKFVRWGLLAVVLIAGGIALYAYNRPVTKLSGRSSQASPPSRTGRETPAARTASSAGPRQQRSTVPADRPRGQTATIDMQKDAVPLKPIGPSDGTALKPVPSTGGRMPVSSASDASRTSAPSVSASSVQPGANQSAPGSAGMTPPQEGHDAVSSSVPPNRSHAREESRIPPRDTGPFANAERMSDGRLKVQALVWASKADDRMAVINNRIVREGSVIDGFSVVGIGEDAVYVKEGGRVLKVPFGRP